MLVFKTFSSNLERLQCHYTISINNNNNNSHTVFRSENINGFIWRQGFNIQSVVWYVTSQGFNQTDIHQQTASHDK